VTIEGVNYTSDPTLFPKIKASLTATIYLSPKTEGTTAGATPTGPDAATPADPTNTPASSDGSTTPTSPAPAAVAVP
jgi:hypothetical protein